MKASIMLGAVRGLCDHRFHGSTISTILLITSTDYQIEFACLITNHRAYTTLVFKFHTCPAKNHKSEAVKDKVTCAVSVHVV